MSVYKRKWKNAKGEDKEAWVVWYSDQQGKPHIKTFTRKKEADAYQTTVRVEIRQGVHTADSVSMTVGEAAGLWLETGVSHELEASTLAAYRQHVALHINPYIGSIRLSQLTAPFVREFENKLRRGDPAAGEEQGTARSPAMVRKIMTSLGSLVGDAYERGLVARNVVRDLRARRKRGVDRQSERRQKGKLKVGVDIPTPTEIKAILAAAEGRWRPFFLTAIFTGLRASELRGLRWADVDLKKAELHVRQRADRYNEIGKPKSAAGERTVPLPPPTVAELRKWKLACPIGEIVFPTGTGAIWHHTNLVRDGLAPVLIKAGVVDKHGRAKYTGLHALRHFYASWCINRRADGGLELPPKVVQERLGHSSIVMTMDVYGHLVPRGDDGGELAAAVQALLD
jgi:integrase